MAGKNRILKFFILVVTFALAGCYSPLGSIGGRNAGSAADLVVVARPAIYEVGESFMPEYLELSYGEEYISPGDCDVFIQDNGAWRNVTASGYPLLTKGEKAIRVEYRTENKTLTGRCTIQVRDPDDNNNGGGDGDNNNGGNNGNSGTPIGYTW